VTVGAEMSASDETAWRALENDACFGGRLFQEWEKAVVTVPWRVVVDAPEVKAIEPITDALACACAMGLSDQEGEEVTTCRHVRFFGHSKSVTERMKRIRPDMYDSSVSGTCASSMPSRTCDCMATDTPS
jgi:hypothetical protein